MSVADDHKNDRNGHQPAVRAREPSFAPAAASGAALPLCVTHPVTGRRSGLVGVAPLGNQCCPIQLMQLKEGQRIECDWHLCFCADFTSSAPLGSPSGTSLLRRSLSSPDVCIIPDSNSPNINVLSKNDRHCDPHFGHRFGVFFR